MTNLPFVSALCITGKTPFHIEQLLPRAVDCFRRQTYPPSRRELIVVADGFAELDEPAQQTFFRVCAGTGESPMVYAHTLPDKRVLGDLRNLSMEYANSGPDCWFIQWDDDDWSHPNRIATQVAAIQEDLPVMLLRQLAYSWRTNSAFVRQVKGVTADGEEQDVMPIPGTILYPADNCPQYPLTAKGEDTEFMAHWERAIALDNDSRLYTRFYHGLNTWGVSHVMPDKAVHDEWRISPREAAYLHWVLTQYDVLAMHAAEGGAG